MRKRYLWIVLAIVLVAGLTLPGCTPSADTASPEDSVPDMTPSAAQGAQDVAKTAA